MIGYCPKKYIVFSDNTFFSVRKPPPPTTESTAIIPKAENCQAICERFPALFLVYQRLAGAKTAMLIRNKPLFLRNKGHSSENNGDFLRNEGDFSESKGLFLHERDNCPQTAHALR